MNDLEKIELAFDILENAEVLAVSTDFIWIKVNRADWNELNLCPYHQRDCENE